jgi:apolipoprotein N-acyltransferase
MAELARGQWFTGFPWSAIGYAHVNSQLSYLAPWVGVYGIGLIAALMGSWLAVAIEKKSSYQKFIPILLIFCIACLPTSRTIDTKGEALQVNLLQGNISQIDKYTSEKQNALDWYSQAMMNSDAQLTVLPEIAIPYFQQELPSAYWDSLVKNFQEKKQIALIGMPTSVDNHHYANSAIGLGFEQQQQYDKYHLVPFGEFTPKFLKWFTDMMVNELGEFKRGDLRQAPFIWKNHRLSVTICYEDLFGEELAARFVNTTTVPTVFVNMSNIAWFGNTMVLNQHLDIARMRSLEFDRPTIRATNTGATAVISAEGVVVKQLPPYTESMLRAEVYSKDTGLTFFAYWAGHWGLMPLWMFCLSLLLLCLVLQRWKTKETAL